VVDKPFTRSVDRRKFINGRWTTIKDSERSVEIASILIQARPERLQAVALAIETLPGAQIYYRDSRGKLVVVVEASDVASIGETLNAMSSMPGVLNASLVFQGTHDD
jgi:periplasmic nitrate reductase NapD